MPMNASPTVVQDRLLPGMVLLGPRPSGQGPGMALGLDSGLNAIGGMTYFGGIPVIIDPGLS
jgi:hypothetical protein